MHFEQIQNGLSEYIDFKWILTFELDFEGTCTEMELEWTVSGFWNGYSWSLSRISSIFLHFFHLALDFLRAS